MSNFHNQLLAAAVRNLNKFKSGNVGDVLFNYYEELINEALIIVGKKAYPKFGTVVILAGGAASGKGFVKDKLLSVHGFVFDVDQLKTLVINSTKYAKKVKDAFGIDPKDLNLKNPDHTLKLHEILKSLGIDDAKLASLYRTIATAAPDRKPNLIFDVTLKEVEKLYKLTNITKTLGYDLKNTHIVWVVNDIEVAKKQNETRDRRVHPEILINTHRNVSSTMYDIITMGERLKNYMDGDIIFAFNQVKVDTDLVKSGKGGEYIKSANYFHIKHAGKGVMDIKKIREQFGKKIASYVPKNVAWG